jgi:hypothetical protein
VGSSARKKVLIFGALGAVGCLLGWLAGEGLLAIGRQARGGEKEVPSLVSRPTAVQVEPPKLEAPPATAPPRPKAPELAKRDAPKPAAPNALAPSIPQRAAPPPLPPDIQKRLEAAGGKSGQLQFTLIWNNRNDLDLHCADPNGEEIYFSHKKATKGSGGHLDVDRNVSGETNTPVENIYFPTGAPLGRYAVSVNYYGNHGDPDPTEYEVSALVEDQRFGFKGKLSDKDAKKLIQEFDLPGIRVAVPSEVALYPGVSNKFRIRLERDKRNTAPVQITFAGESAGVTLPAELTIPEGRDDAEVKVAAAPDATLGARKVRVTAAGKFGSVATEFKVVVAPTPATLQLAVPAEVVLHPGGKNQFSVYLLRSNHDGPVTLSLAGDAPGLTLPTEPVTVPGDKSEAVFEVSAVRATVAGTRALKVIAKGKHGEVAEPCRVTVVIPPAAIQIAVAKSISVQQGTETTLTVLVARDWYTGPVTVRGSSPNRGVAAWEATIPAGRDSVEMKVTAFADAKEGLTPLTLTAVGGTARAETETALEITPPPPPPALTKSGPGWSWLQVLIIGLWTALLAVGLSLALVAGQNRYLGRSWLSGRQLGLILACGSAAGLVAGGIGQTLFGLLARGGVLPEIGFIAGWLLLGGLLGRGLAFFIPNLHPVRAALAGVAGGLFGAVAFILMSKLGDTYGRFVGAALLGGCIGLMVALVELAFRSAWLEVHYSEREVITVNLGPEPVKIGSDSRACTVWARGSAPLALRFWIRDGKVVCEDSVNRTTDEVSNGDRRRAGSLEVVVRTGSGEASERTVPKPARSEARSKPVDDPLPLPMPTSRPAAAPKSVSTRATSIPCPRCKTKLALGTRVCSACGASW